MKNLLAILALWSPCIAATTTSEASSLTILGNERTKDSFIRNVFRKCWGEKTNKAITETSEIEQCIMNTKQFSKVSLTTNQGNYILKVKDRWTLIPIPMIQVGNGDKRYGLILADSNFGGLGKVMGLGGFFSNRGNTYFLTYQDKAVFLSDWNTSISGISGTNDLILYDQETQIDGYREEKKSASWLIGYTYNETNVSVKLVRHRTTNANYELFKNSNTDNEGWKAGLQVVWKSVNYKIFFDEGFAVTLRSQRDLTRSDNLKENTNWSGTIYFGMDAFTGNAFIFNLYAGKTIDGSALDDFRLGLRSGFRGSLDKSIWAQTYKAISFDYQIPLKELRFGTWTFAPFLDRGRIKSKIRSNIDFQTYGIGTYIYLKEIAVPGVGIETGTNNRYQNRFVAISLGLSI